MTKKPEDKNRRTALEEELKVTGVKVDQQLLEASQTVIRADHPSNLFVIRNKVK